MNHHKGKKIGELTVEEYEEVITHLNADIYDRIVKLNTEVNALKEENERITMEMMEWKERTMLLERDLAQVDKRQRRANIVFKGLNDGSSPRNAVEEICTQVLKVPNVSVKEAKKAFQRNGKMTVIAEVNDEATVNNLLRSSANLKGSNISIDRDLTRDSRNKKTAMLKIKRDLNGLDNSKKIVVRDEKMKVENTWFYWNRDNTLMTGSLEGRPVLQNIFNDSGDVSNLDFNYKSILDKFYKK